MGHNDLCAPFAECYLVLAVMFVFAFIDICKFIDGPACVFFCRAVNKGIKNLRWYGVEYECSFEVSA